MKKICDDFIFLRIFVSLLNWPPGSSDAGSAVVNSDAAAVADRGAHEANPGADGVRAQSQERAGQEPTDDPDRNPDAEPPRIARHEGTPGSGSAVCGSDEDVGSAIHGQL